MITTSDPEQMEALALAGARKAPVVIGSEVYRVVDFIDVEGARRVVSAELESVDPPPPGLTPWG